MNNFFIEHECSPIEADAIYRNIKHFNEVKRKLRRTYIGLSSKSNRRITRRRLLTKAYPQEVPRIAHHAAHLAITPMAPDTLNDWMLITGAEAGWIRNSIWHSMCGDIRICASLRRVKHKKIETWPFNTSDRRRCSWVGMNNNTLRIHCAHASRKLQNTDQISNSFNLISSCWTDQCILPGDTPHKTIPQMLRKFSDIISSHNLDYPILSFELNKRDVRLKIDGDTYRQISEHSDPHAMLLNTTCANALVIHHGHCPRDAWLEMRKGNTAKTIKWFSHENQKKASEFKLHILKTCYKWTTIQLNHGRSTLSIISTLLFLSETILAAGIAPNTHSKQATHTVSVHANDSLNSLCKTTFGYEITSRTTMRLLEHAAHYCFDRDALTIEGAISLAHDLRKSIAHKVPDSIFYCKTPRHTSLACHLA